MPGRSVSLVNNEYYHLYNRGIEKRIIFSSWRDYERFRQTLFYYQFENQRLSFSRFSKSKIVFNEPLSKSKVIEIICYCLMPNHFHFLVKQRVENGIVMFMSKLANSYTKYFNAKYDRVGPLMQCSFKAVRVETDEQLLHLSRYIHLNPVVSGITKEINKYKWSSYNEFMLGSGLICSIDDVLNYFNGSAKKYNEFIKKQIDYGILLEKLKH